MSVGRTLLITFAMLMASIWVGSLVCLAIVARVSHHALSAQARIEFFRRVGKIYGVVGTGCLAFAIVATVAIYWPPSEFPGVGLVAFGLAVLLMLFTIVGMLQAKTMTIARQREVEMPGDASARRRLERGARLAGTLRLTIAMVTFVILFLGARLLDG
ncbi:MAG: hypothetical protein AB7N61_18330 [Acidimicrobiia bacterium]